MPIDLTDKRVLLTGASSGIGAALAQRLAGAGATLGLTGRDEARLTGVLDACRTTAPDSLMVVADLAYPAEVNRLARWALDEFGGVDILVNNAGIPKRRHTMGLSADEVDGVTQINYLAPVRLTLALLPHLLDKTEARIVNVSSVGALLSSPAEAAYSASKAALTVFTETMAIDLFDSGVTVQLVYPGVVDTPLFSVPDNDDLETPIEPIPVGDAVDQFMAIFENDELVTFIPPDFAALCTGKAQDVPGFLTGAADFVRATRGPAAVGDTSASS